MVTYHYGGLIHKRNLFCLPRQKGGGSCILSKNRANIGKIGLSGGGLAVREPDFFHFRQQKRAKMLVYFFRFFALQRTPKIYGMEGFEPPNTEN